VEDRKHRSVPLSRSAPQGGVDYATTRTITLNLRISIFQKLKRSLSILRLRLHSLLKGFWRGFDRFEKVVLLRLPKPIAKRLYRLRPKRRNHPAITRFGWGFMALLMTGTIAMQVYQARGDSTAYALSARAQTLLKDPSEIMAQALKFNSKNGAYEYNKGYQAPIGKDGESGNPKFSATFAQNISKDGMTVTDSVNNTTIKITPDFATRVPQQNQNQLVYPLTGRDAQKVYTLGASGVKEDIILNKEQGDKVSFSYRLGLPSGTTARLEPNGTLAIYGVASALLGNVTTGSDADAALLEKARANSEKKNLLFTFPAPFVVEYGKKVSTIKTWYSLEGTELTVHARGLKTATYPLSIDPTVYIETARKLMRGNNETNTDFDIDNELIQKSQTTGARIDAWSSTSNLSSAVWGQGTAVAGGYIYSAGGVGSGTTTTSSYTTAGSSSFVVPAGVSYLTVKVWGAGGGGGAGSGSSGVGGSGGGGGYAKGVISVTAGETLTVNVGTGGAKASANGRAGNGGGASAVKRSSTFLVEGGGGGGGAGRRGNTSGTTGNAGAGGGTTGQPGRSGSAGGPGGGGTQSTGGAGGTGTASGATGASQAGGNGASTAACATSVTGTGGAGGTGGGGSGGTFTSSCAAGGGGGGGYYGGGGGASTSTTNRSGGGGGGGSSYINPTGLVAGTDVNTIGNYQTPGNSGDSDRTNLADGGSGATTAASATAGENGVVTISYVAAGSVTDAVYWAQFNSSTRAIDAPNPGNGACAGWCTNSAYNLPAARTGLSLVSYNGFLYAIGGSNSSGTPQTTVYIAKLGANGEPQLWHPTDTNKNNWVYWYADTALSNARSNFAAVAYNNRMYILGGLTASTTVLSTNTVQVADVNPTGTLGTWTTTGMAPLGVARYGLTAHVYNDTLYTLGGNTTFTGTPVTTVEYVKLKSDGTMNSWVTNPTSIITSGRMTGGGSFSTIYGGYVYIAGGCTAVNASGYCTGIATDVQLASINANGSLSEFNTVLNLANDRFAHTLIGWQGGLYRLGGCRAQDSITGACTNTALDVDYGVINPPGEASTVATSTDNTQAPCNAATPTNCNMPSASVGNMLNVTAVVNGYLYIMGGCTNNACTSYSTGVTYQAIASDGSLQRPAACTGSYTDSYCVSSASLPTAISAAGVTVFNGRIYVVGGFPTVSNIYYVSVNADGSLGTWQNNDTNTGTSTAADAVSYTFAYARANPASAGSNPGNLFILGGCSGTISGIGCSGYSQNVYKCNITSTGTVTSCSTSGQLLIGTVTGNDGNPAGGTGLGAFAGAVYANYIYLMGGLAPGANGTDLKDVRYAKFDDSNNIIAVSGGAWIEGPSQMNTGRRRGAGFGYNGYLYILGGYDGADAIADIEFAKINVSDGSWGAFETSSVTIQKRWALATVVSNSYAYVIGGCIAGQAPSSCSSRTNTIQTFQIYNNDSGVVRSYSNAIDDTFAANTDRWGASAAVLNGYIYVAGGCISATDCTDATNNVQYAPISSSDGSVGTWASATNALTADRAWGQLETAGGFLYYLGGQDDAGTAQSTVYYVGSFSSGDINAAWSTATKPLGDTGGGGQARRKFGATVWNNRIYVVAGYNASNTVQNTVFISPQLASGGNITANWTSDADAPDVARYGGAVTAYANNLYLFGGNDGTNYLSDAQFSKIDSSNGTIGAWTFTTALPSYLSEADAFAANGYMYIVGGRSAASSCRPSTLIAPISANTTIASGNNPTGVGEWSSTNVRYAGGRYGVALAYSQGTVFVMGGGCTSPQNGSYTTGTITQSSKTVTGVGTNWTDNYIGNTITYADASTATVVAVTSTTSLVVSATKTIASAQSYTLSAARHQYGALKSQPQVAKYSRMIDTDTDVFANSWLLNGLDNSTGARWYLRYRSMTDIDGVTADCVADMTTWGQEYNHGEVTLGNVGTFVPRDGSGTSTNCARYYYFSVNIDSSQAFGYPEDVTRGPTITDLSLFYTADPSKRMLHGKTFTGGEQQPLDTPCRRGAAVSGDPNYNCPLP
jgi:hypothetical protein